MATTVENRRETGNLIGSDKVDGTAVYGATYWSSTPPLFGCSQRQFGLPKHRF
jgi:hypothetical protein